LACNNLRPIGKHLCMDGCERRECTEHRHIAAPQPWSVIGKTHYALPALFTQKQSPSPTTLISQWYLAT
jgi:hypothetical protein